MRPFRSPVRRPAAALASLLALPMLAATPSAPPFFWGSDGHEMAARAAVETLPEGIPAFFRDAGDQLVYLDPEPDRWRSRELTAMDQAFSYDHYIDLENVPADALDAPQRWEYVRRLYAAGLERPERDAGFLPYRIVELYQRLLAEWRLWRQASGEEREWIQQRIVNDAGILGHYVTDAAQPQHTTIHFNGWSSDAPNPRGYTTERDFHYRFETGFVGAHVRYPDIRSAMPARPARDFRDVRSAVMDHILESNRQVERLYRLEQESPFDDDPEARAPADHVAFAAERLAAGGAMLRDLWWTAWLDSGRPAEGSGR